MHNKQDQISNNSNPKKTQKPLKNVNTSISSSSSSISIEPPKGCLRFFSKNANVYNPRLKSKPVSRYTNPLKENVEKKSFGEKKVGKDCTNRMHDMCLMKRMKEKKASFIGKNVSGLNRSDKLAYGLDFKRKFNRPDSRFGSSRYSKKDLKKKDIMGDEIDLVKKPTDVTKSEIYIDAKLASGSEFECELDKTQLNIDSIKCVMNNEFDIVEKSTPINKLDKSATTVTSSDGASATPSTTTTPPVQPSVSPEINCASSSVLAVSASQTPACYSAGHLISGVTDRRKCRARGILTVGQNDSSCSKLKMGEYSEGLEAVKKARTSLVPFPAEASMHWILSPCEEVDEDIRTNQSSGCRNLSDLCNIFDSSSGGSASSGKRNKITILSPSRSPVLEGIFGASSGKVRGLSSASPSCEVFARKEVKKDRYNSTMENSPFSCGLLDSGNVIQTPQSFSSSDKHVNMTCSNSSEKKIYDSGYDINCASEDLMRFSLSPKSNRSISDSPDFSFHLPEFHSPSSCADFSQLPNAWANGSSFISCSRSNEMSASDIRVSWRDGLSSRIFEMDESDICRCLSDDENDANKSSNRKLNSSFINELNDNICDPENGDQENVPLEFVVPVLKYDKEREENLGVKRSNPCEESICTDDGGLAASGDSDWTSYYKNQLFQV